jgi:hypothetical protein
LQKEASRLAVCPGPKRERFSKLVFSKWVLNKFEFLARTNHYNKNNAPA